MGVSWRWYSGDNYQKWSKGDPTKIRMANLRPILDGHPGWVMVTMVVLAITGTLEISMDWWSLAMSTKQPDDHQTTGWNKKPGDSQNCQRVFTSEFEQWLWVKNTFHAWGIYRQFRVVMEAFANCTQTLRFPEANTPLKSNIGTQKNNQAEN